MSEAVIGVVVGGLLGVIGTVAGTFVNYRLRQEERKSDRKRELYERELRIVSGSVDAIVDTVRRLEWGAVEGESPPELVREVSLMMAKAHLVTISLGDQELEQSYMELSKRFSEWFQLFDLGNERAVAGKEDEFEELTVQVEVAGSQVWRRIREILEEV